MNCLATLPEPIYQHICSYLKAELLSKKKSRPEPLPPQCDPQSRTCTTSITSHFNMASPNGVLAASIIVTFLVWIVFALIGHLLHQRNRKLWHSKHQTIGAATCCGFVLGGAFGIAVGFSIYYGTFPHSFNCSAATATAIIFSLLMCMVSTCCGWACLKSQDAVDYGQVTCCYLIATLVVTIVTTALMAGLLGGVLVPKYC